MVTSTSRDEFFAYFFDFQAVDYLTVASIGLTAQAPFFALGRFFASYSDRSHLVL